VKARWAVQRQIAAGFSAAQIAEVQERITGGVIPEWLTAESREEARGYQETAIALIAAHRAAETTQSTTTARAAEHQEEGSAVSAEPDPAPEIKPATQWQKGALTAHQIITAQAAAGYSADRIAGKWEGALATYDDATAAAEERQWHQGASETAADMIQTLRDMERAEAEQAQVDRDQAARDQARPALEAEAG
jgi:hypothetical protein